MLRFHASRALVRIRIALFTPHYSLLTAFMTDSTPQSKLQKLHSETALMHWVDLQRFFAQGKVLNVDRALNLVETAVLFADDDARSLEPLITSEQVAAPNNDQARAWFEANAELWTVVVAPYVLVQEAIESDLHKLKAE